MGKKKKLTSKHEIIRNEKGQYMKGYTGNPGGRPKNTLTTILKERMMDLYQNQSLVYSDSETEQKFKI